MKFRLMTLLLILVPTFLGTSTIAQTEGILNKLLAPGPLVKGHSDLEKKDCLKCHEPSKGAPDVKCLECHKEIEAFVSQKKGFHGLTTQSCFSCHSEHKGREHDTLAIDEATFKHAEFTGYDLEGKHADLKCAQCHKGVFSAKFVGAGKIRYVGNQSSCVSCHKKDDVHFFKGDWGKKDCNACHSLKSWKTEIKFNHEKDTKYKLEGKHAELKCADCHGPNKTIKQASYKWPQLKSGQCLTCHTDFHKSNLSKKFQTGKCLTCHNQTNWKIQQFDHKISGYPLRGKHAELKCIECHKQSSVITAKNEIKYFNFTGTKSSCLSCHKDYHLFGKLKTVEFGDPNRCQNCHTETNWKTIPQFDHNRHTKYAVDGAHSKLNCLECHTQNIETKAKYSVGIYKWQNLATKTCEACHATPHVKEFSAEFLKKKCTECHVTTSWYDMKNGKTFDHAKTRFQLTGSHLQIKCADCHGPQKNQVFKFKSVELKFCIDCHQNIHKDQFSSRTNSQNCSQCHSTENFKERLTFDHAKTSYPLEGAHTKITCTECHVPTQIQIKLARPNIHRDYGSDYSKMATPIIPENSVLNLAKFQFPQLKKNDCVSCHVDYHKTQLGAQCLDCHNIESWKKIAFDHTKQSRFALKGKHGEVKCSECHKAIPEVSVTYKKQQVRVIRFKPLKDQCQDCHKDVHKGAFGQSCQECHNEKGWKLTKDFHKNFTLTGVHYSLSCNECHTNNRNLSGLSQQCYTCHKKDDVHSGTLPQCQDCHRQQFWEVTGFKHSLTQLPLRGVHRTLDCMECHRSGTYKGLSPNCASCHLQEALAVTTPAHSGFSNLNRCNECHLNHFAW